MLVIGLNFVIRTRPRREDCAEPNTLTSLARAFFRINCRLRSYPLFSSIGPRVRFFPAPDGRCPILFSRGISTRLHRRLHPQNPVTGCCGWPAAVGCSSSCLKGFHTHHGEPRATITGASAATAPTSAAVSGHLNHLCHLCNLLQPARLPQLKGAAPLATGAENHRVKLRSGRGKKGKVIA